MIHLSVNVNKIATIRNSRGGAEPRVTQAVAIALEAGAPGVTIHPRADERHIRRSDVPEVADVVARWRASGRQAELNIEGDPRPDLIETIEAVRPDQCTLVPVMPGEITSQAGWPADTPPEALRTVIQRLQRVRVRVSLFVDPDLTAVEWASRLGADRIELYTEPFAKAYARSEDEGRRAFATYASAAVRAHDLGMGVNAGHDLDLQNLRMFRELPHLAEVSIGHALITHALWVGLDRAVRDYVGVLSSESRVVSPEL
jgi:pyridoxine 5-phosphate synthase